jgi:AsmA-like C-terminal region
MTIGRRALRYAAVLLDAVWIQCSDQAVDRDVRMDIGNEERVTKRIKQIGVAALIGLALLALVPWLVPSSAWIPRVEAAAAQRLGVPVKINSMRVAILPLPHLTITGLDLADGAIQANSIAVYPRLLSMLSTTRVLRTLNLNDVSVSKKGIEWISAQAAKTDPPASGSGGAAEAAPALVLERLRISGLRAELAAGQLPALNLEVELNRSSTMPISSALAATADGKAKLRLEPAVATPAVTGSAAGGSTSKAWTLTLDATDWQMPLGPPLKFTSLKGKGSLTGSRLVMNDLAGALYGGTLNGKLELTWLKTWSLKGDAQVANLDINSLTQALKLKAALSGQLDAAGPFNSQSPKPAGLGDALTADIGFKVNRGVLQGFDLASAAKNLLKGGGGGNTQFDELTGRVKVAGRAYKLSNLRVTSGVLKAEGNLDISATKHLSGRIDTEIKGTGGMVGVPLAVSGTLDSPILLPTKGSMVGAAVGTVLLPGVGTSVGSSVGDKLGKFFGK